MPRHGNYPALGSPQVAGKEKLITNLAWPGRRLACNDDFSHRGGGGEEIKPPRHFDRQPKQSPNVHAPGCWRRAGGVQDDAHVTFALTPDAHDVI